MFDLLEDNKTIEDLIDYINNKIVSLRTNKGIHEEILSSIQSQYSSVVYPWMNNNYIKNIEIDDDETFEIQNQLVELISYLNKL